jgi:hypothetical protein
MNEVRKITKKEWVTNEDFNRHSRNALRVAQSYGTEAELKLIEEINWTHAEYGSIAFRDQQIRDSIVNKYFTQMTRDWS